MAGQRDEVNRYKSTMKRIIEKWQKETQLKLSKDVLAIAKELEELQKIKKPGPDEKKQMVDLLKAGQEVAKKSLKASMGKLGTEVKKVKQPELGESDNPHVNLAKDMEEFSKKYALDGVDLNVPDTITNRFKWLKDLKITLNIEDPTVGLDAKGIGLGRSF
jgi:hypothetical protein